MGFFDGALNAFGAALGQAGAGFGALLGSSGGGFTSGVSKGPGFGVGQSPGSSFRVGGLSGPGFGVGRASGGGFGVRGFAGNGFNTGNPNRFAKPVTTQATPTTTTGEGAEPNVARWSTQASEAFGDLVDPDVMLAIMTNESGGDPNAYNASGNAYGLFQQVGLGSYDPNVQFQAARKLLEQKLVSIKQAYAANGLNPDERTRARDIALAWAGHFDYATGRPNPTSRDVGSGQTAEQLSQIFLANYDRLKASKQRGTASGITSMWGDINAPISQEYGVVSPDVDQSIYTYGKDYGLAGGHTGLDIGLKRGTQLYMPAGRSGTVVTAGGTKFFRDEDYGDYGTPGKGELRIQMSDGAVLILGHTSAINVRVGQQVTAGTLLGLSGSASGDHLHLEVRVPDKTMPYGYRIVDPRTYFGGR